MKLSMILQDKGPDVVTVESNTSLWAASGILDKHKIGATVVVDEAGSVCGVLSERDIVRRVAQLGADALTLSVEAAMTRNVISAAPSMTVDSCLELMTDRRIRHLPVLEDGKLLGIVSIGDLVKRKIALTVAEAEAMKQYIHAG